MSLLVLTLHLKTYSLTYAQVMFGKYVYFFRLLHFISGTWSIIGYLYTTIDWLSNSKSARILYYSPSDTVFGGGSGTGRAFDEKVEADDATDISIPASGQCILRLAFIDSSTCGKRLKIKWQKDQKNKMVPGSGNY